ncbi:MAG TPA: hypothetical protein VGF39_03265 [Stellaceae bacterium]
MTSSLIYRWRRDLRAAANGFARVLVAPAGDGIAAPPPMAAIELELAGNTRPHPSFGVARIGRRSR